MECVLEGLLDEILISLLKLFVAVPKTLPEVTETAEEVLKLLLEGPLADTLSERVLLLTELVAWLLDVVPWVLPEDGLGLLVDEDVVASDIGSDLLWVVKY